MRVNRRDLLRAAASAGALGMAWPLSSRLTTAQAQQAAQDLGASWDPAPFTLGVASGDPLPDSVVLWTRLAPQPLADTQPLPDYRCRTRLAPRKEKSKAGRGRKRRIGERVSKKEIKHGVQEQRPGTVVAPPEGR